MTMPTRANLFDPRLVADLLNKVNGHSAIARLSGQSAIPFNGMKEFTFSMDSEMDIVAENGAKSHGGVTLEPVTIVPFKMEYGARISSEILYATEEEQIAILQAFNEGFAKKLASALDIAAFHGLNPRTLQASSIIGTNNLDAKATAVAYSSSKTMDEMIEEAINAVEAADAEVTGLALSPKARQELASIKNAANERLYPELAWGGNPGTINGLATDVNKTVATHASAGKEDYAIVGDFANAFKWGYAKNIPLTMIEYGDPDNTGNDLAGHNQVYLRAEVYIGFGILNEDAFAVVAKA